jgi:integrase
MARKPIKVYRRGQFYHYQLLDEHGWYGTPHSTRVSISKPINIAEQEVIAIIAGGNLPKKREEGIPKTVIISQIRRYLQSHALLQKDQAASVNDLLDALSLDLNGVSLKKNNPLFIEYLLKFWNWEESDYLKDKLAGGFKIGKSYADDYLNKVKNHAVPFFDPNLRIRDVTTGLLEEYKKYLMTKKNTLRPSKKSPEEELPNLSTKTVTELIQAVTKPLREAQRLGLISTNPAIAMTRLAKSKRARGILTSAEVQKVFAAEWQNEKSRVANSLACLSGMRAGEIGALRPSDLRIEDGKGLIMVNHSWERFQKVIKGTKSEKPRIVCVPAFLIDDLLQLHKQNIHENGEFIFWGMLPDKPIRLDHFLVDLRQVLNSTGVSYEEQEKRNITFHSWRHYYNSTLRGSVPDETLRKFIGHENKEMTDNYDHVTEEQIDAVYKAMEEKILPFVRKAG